LERRFHRRLRLGPDWLIRIATARRVAGNGQAIAPTLPKDWEALLSREHEGSHRAAFVARVFGHFVRKYCEPVAAVDALDEQWCKPPLGRDEVVRICADIANLEAERRGVNE
jgi:hypothetical protein